MKTKKFHRAFHIGSVATRTLESGEDVVRIAISTETPYRRSRLNGHKSAYEVLGHTPAEIDLSYLESGAPFLLEHKTDVQIGVLENITIDEDRVLRADVRFSNSALGQEILDDVKRGIRTRISVGYEVIQYEDVGTDADGIPIVRATRWMPYESSIVSIPADRNAGVGRSLRDAPVFVYDENDILTSVILPDGTEITDPTTIQALVAEEQTETVAEAQTETVAEEQAESVEAATVSEEEEVDDSNKSLLINTINREAQKAALQEQNSMLTKEQIDALSQLATRHNMTDKLGTWISEARSVESVKAEILDSRANDDKVIGAPAVHTRTVDKTFAGAVKSFLKNDNSELAERGVDQARSMGRSINIGTLYIPTDVDMIPAKRSTAYTNTGVNATGKEFLSWVETVREGSLLSRVGGQIITLADIGSVPYFSAPTTASNFHETGSSTDSETTIGTYTWTPKRVSARYVMSNLQGRLNGTYDFEGILYNDLVGEGIRKFEQQVWSGTGTNNVTGLLYDTNVQTLTNSGSFALASASLMAQTVAQRGVNADNGMFVVNNAVYSYAFSNPAFPNGSDSILSNLKADGKNFIQSSHLSQYDNGGSVGLKNTAIFGDFSKVIAANFGPLEITRDAFTKLQTGETVLQLEMFIDSVASRPADLVKWTNIG